MTTLVIDDPDQWFSELPEVCAEIFSGEVVARLIARRPEYFDFDDLQWLNDAIADALGQTVESDELFLEAICRGYRSIRGYHGTRCAITSRYRQNGLIVLPPGAAIEKARKFFCSGRFPEITEAAFAVAAGRKHHIQPPKVWFTAGRRHLIKDCGHYLLYGSEQVIAIAVGITTNTRYDYRQALKLVGRPTLIVCDIPIGQIPREFLKSYTNKVLASWFEEAVTGARSFDYTGGFPATGNVGPECIISIEHPPSETINDPYAGTAWLHEIAPWQARRSA